MAFAVIGGLLSATLATLTLLPAAISLIFTGNRIPDEILPYHRLVLD
jgi:Cu/Ag efflux pump CusA